MQINLSTTMKQINDKVANALYVVPKGKQIWSIKIFNIMGLDNILNVKFGKYT